VAVSVLCNRVCELCGLHDLLLLIYTSVIYSQQCNPNTEMLDTDHKGCSFQVLALPLLELCVGTMHGVLVSVCYHFSLCPYFPIEPLRNSTSAGLLVNGCVQIGVRTGQMHCCSKHTLLLLFVCVHPDNI